MIPLPIAVLPALWMPSNSDDSDDSDESDDQTVSQALAQARERADRREWDRPDLVSIDSAGQTWVYHIGDVHTHGDGVASANADAAVIRTDHAVPLEEAR